MNRTWAWTIGLSLVLAGMGPVCAGATPPGVTTSDAMLAQLRAEAAHCPLIRLASLGKSASGQRDLWLVRLADPQVDRSKTVRLLVLCRQHGDEPASTEAMLGLLRRVTSGGDPALRDSLSRVTLYLVPMVNPDGADANTRLNAAGADLNRDWGPFTQPESRAVQQAVALIQPHVIVDAHNWDGDEAFIADCLEVPRLTQTPLERADHAMQARSVAHLAASGYVVRATAYHADKDPRLAHRYFTRQGLIACLVETHPGDPTDHADFARRQGLYVALIQNLVRHYAAHYSEEWPRLNHLEGYSATAAARDMRLFPSPHSSPLRAARAGPLPYLWLWALCLYALALWAAHMGRGISDVRIGDESLADRRRRAKRPSFRRACRPGSLH